MGIERTSSIPQEPAGACPLREASWVSPRGRGDSVDTEPAFALVTALLLIVLLVSVGAELALVTSTEAVAAGRRHHTLAHQLAVDSALLVLAERLDPANPASVDVIQSLDRFGEARQALQFGEVQVTCTLRDDATKFNPSFFQRPDEAFSLTRKLEMLGTQLRLPPARVELKPLLVEPSDTPGLRYMWYDQLLGDVTPGALFNLADAPAQRSAWSDTVTFWGDGRIDLRRADAQILEVALEDIRPGLGGKLLATRPADPTLNFMRTALISVDAEIRQRVAARLTFDAKRYALRIDTAVAADRRRWYVVACMDGGECEVLHRSQLRW